MDYFTGSWATQVTHPGEISHPDVQDVARSGSSLLTSMSLRILIVDDDRRLYELLASYL